MAYRTPIYLVQGNLTEIAYYSLWDCQNCRPLHQAPFFRMIPDPTGQYALGQLLKAQQVLVCSAIECYKWTFLSATCFCIGFGL